MKKILITGITGFLGKHIANEFDKYENIEVYGASRQHISDKVLSYDEIFNLTDLHFDTIIHCAFARESVGSELLNSLSLLEKLLDFARNQNVNKFINISSQSVYGNILEEFADEEAVLNPSYLYAFAKAVSENIVNKYSDSFLTTNIRLAGLTGGIPPQAKGVIPLFVSKATNNDTVNITNSQNRLSIIDVRDAAAAIVKLSELNQWETNYNLANSWQVTIEELIIQINKQTQERLGCKAQVDIQDNNQQYKLLINSDKLFNAINWTPEYTLEMIIDTFISNLEGN